MTCGLRPSRPLGSASPTGVFGHPLHPALAHLPVGAWACSLVFDVASQLVQGPGYLAVGSHWLIAIGVLGAVAAAAAGLADLPAVARDARACPTANAHMLINVLLIFAYAGILVRQYSSHPVGAPVGADMLALSDCCAVTQGVSCYLGGKLTYGYGATVAAPVGSEVDAAAYPARSVRSWPRSPTPALPAAATTFSRRHTGCASRDPGTVAGAGSLKSDWR